MKRLLYVLITIIIFSCGGGSKVVVNKKDSYISDKYANLLNVHKSEIENIKLYSFCVCYYYLFGCEFMICRMKMNITGVNFERFNFGE